MTAPTPTPDTPAPLNAGEREELARELAQRLTCSQCGRPFSRRACGPTHAIIAADPIRHRLIAPLVADLRAERDALAERVERVKALAGKIPCENYLNPHSCLTAGIVTRCAPCRLRAALDVSPEPDETGGGR